MEENNIIDQQERESDRAHQLDDENEERKFQSRQKTPAQEVLITKILKSGKILDKEYRSLIEVLNSKVVTTYDAAIFIEYVLGMLKFRRHFFNGKHKSYKKCKFCKSRDDVDRFLDLDTNKSFWCCETCALNLNQVRVVLTKYAEQREVSADLHRKYDYSELTPAQEDLICEHREE